MSARSGAAQRRRESRDIGVVTPEIVYLAAAKIAIQRKRAAESEAARIARLEAEQAEHPETWPRFRGANLEALMDRSPESMNSGPAETGKTWMRCWQLDSIARETPNGTGAILRKVGADMLGSVIQTWKRVIAIRGGVEVYGGEKPIFYDYANGFRVYVAGLDNPGKALSSERDIIYANQAEEFTLDDWEHLSLRTTGRGAVTKTAMLVGDCNPGPKTHWILARPTLKMFRSRHEDNPALFNDDGTPTTQWITRTQPALDALTGIRRLRLRDGLWESAEGTVYDFDKTIHGISRAALPRMERWFVAVDFGFTNAFVAQLWGEDHDGRLYLTREIYKTQRTVKNHCPQIREMIAGHTIEAWICDHDAEDRATLEEELGIATLPAFKAVGVGIQAVQTRLAKAGDDKPRLYIVEDALMERDESLVARHKPTCTAEEIQSYVWPKGVDGKSMKEVPVKENDHGMDAKRYLVCYVDGIVDTKEAGWTEIVRGAAKDEPTKEPESSLVYAESDALKEAKRINAERATAQRGSLVSTTVRCACGNEWAVSHSPEDRRVKCPACTDLVPLGAA